MSNMDKARRLLRKHWGYEEFRKNQAVVVKEALDRTDGIAVLPTGDGKSVCFQIPALYYEGGAIVISPLIALMKDQVDDCTRRKIAATCINSHVDEDEAEERLQDFIGGVYKLLYIAPERLNSKHFMHEIGRADVSYIVVDEAHCCSEWGHDFRPDYMRIDRLVKVLTKRDGERPPIIAVTATATDLVVRDIVKSLGMTQDYWHVVADPIRPNIRYTVEDCTGSSGRSFNVARDIIEKMDLVDGRHIIYGNTRSLTEKLAEMVQQIHRGASAEFYHAGMKQDERERVQESFKSGETPVICATTAFGMGVDVPNIRTVLNFGVPGSLEAFVQQSGRAGRDGLPSEAIVLVDDYSLGFQWRAIENENPPWPLYGLVWEWLHRVLQPDQTLRKTLNDIAAEITAGRRDVISAPQAGVVLNMLHSRGLIDKRPVDAGTPVQIITTQLQQTIALGSRLPDTTRIWKALWDDYVVPATTSGANFSPEITVYVNKRQLMDQAKVKSALRVTKALEGLLNKGIRSIGDTYTGNMIRVLKWRADITKTLPLEEIEAKGKSDRDRFRAMLSYTEAGGERERTEFLRRYFLAAVDVE